MSNEFNAMGKNEVVVLYSAMAYALDNWLAFRYKMKIDDVGMATFQTLFSELSDAAEHHGLEKI